MKALQLQAIGKLQAVDIAVPSIAEDQLLIRTGTAVICTSDLNDLKENPFGIKLPVVMGHEGAGTVSQVGKKVKGFAVGDRVATHPVHPCGACPNCRSGMGHLCSDMGHFGLNMPGTFAEYYIVRADRARVVPKHMPFPVAALAEPVSVCLEALAQAQVKEGAKLLILGDGPFGALIARLAVGMKMKVVVAGRHDFRLKFAGATITVNVNKVSDPMALLRSHAQPLGYDAAILAVGSAQAVQQGLSLLRPKGRLVIFSAVTGGTPIDLFSLHIKELEIVGACNDDNRFDAAVARLADASLGLDKLITHVLPVEDYPKAFDLAAHGREEAMKVALAFEKAEAR